MLYFIGLGLGTSEDITLKGLKAIKSSEVVFLEGYTSLLESNIEELEALYNKKVIVLDRSRVEEDNNIILEEAEQKTVSFLVVGDVFGATTHSDLYLRAINKGIKVEVIHNASIINAVSQTGLELYRFGKTVTLVLPEKNYAPESFYDGIIQNKQLGLHTLCLLDIKTDKNVYQTIPEACKQLLDITARRDNKLSSDTKAVGVARLGWSDQMIVFGNLNDLQDINWPGPPHSLIIPGNLSVVEEEMLKLYQIK